MEPACSDGATIVPNPLVNLQTDLTKFSNIPAFRVSSSTPSYWRLTSLDSFDGSQWTSTGSYRSIGRRLPGSPPANTAVKTAVATFNIQQLDSVWLPVAKSHSFLPVAASRQYILQSAC